MAYDHEFFLAVQKQRKAALANVDYKLAAALGVVSALVLTDGDNINYPPSEVNDRVTALARMFEVSK